MSNIDGMIGTLTDVLTKLQDHSTCMLAPCTLRLAVSAPYRLRNSCAAINTCRVDGIVHKYEKLNKL